MIVYYKEYLDFELLECRMKNCKGNLKDINKNEKMSIKYVLFLLLLNKIIYEK